MKINGVLLYKDFILDDFISLLLNFDDEYRPLFYSADEKDLKKKEIKEIELFDKFVKENMKYGFFLSNDHVQFDIRVSRKEVWVEIDSNYATNIFFMKLFESKLYWGHFGLFDEYRYRNKIQMELGNSNYESWVGRSLKDRIPGLYWVNLFSDEIYNDYTINKDKISNELGYHLDDFSNGFCLYLYKFPEQWGDYINTIDAYIKKHKDVFFDKEEVERKLTDVTSYSEYSLVIREYK